MTSDKNYITASWYLTDYNTIWSAQPYFVAEIHGVYQNEPFWFELVIRYFHKVYQIPTHEIEIGATHLVGCLVYLVDPITWEFVEDTQENSRRYLV